MSQKLLSSKCTLVTIIFQCDIGDNYKDRSGWTALLSQQTADDRREREYSSMNTEANATVFEKT